MKCPVCRDASLVMSDRQGIEIDYCPDCRGVWLDRGELDKIIERSGAPATEQRDRRDDREPPRPSRDWQDREAPRRKKKGGFLGDLFEF